MQTRRLISLRRDWMVPLCFCLSLMLCLFVGVFVIFYNEAEAAEATLGSAADPQSSLEPRVSLNTLVNTGWSLSAES